MEPTDIDVELLASRDRLSIALAELADSVRELRTTVIERDLRPRVERCEQDIADLRRQLDPK